MLFGIFLGIWNFHVVQLELSSFSIDHFSFIADPAISVNLTTDTALDTNEIKPVTYTSNFSQLLNFKVQILDSIY